MFAWNFRTDEKKKKVLQTNYEGNRNHQRLPDVKYRAKTVRSPPKKAEETACVAILEESFQEAETGDCLPVQGIWC